MFQTVFFPFSLTLQKMKPNLTASQDAYTTYTWGIPDAANNFSLQRLLWTK